jgi:signal transduction histidine kinase
MDNAIKYTPENGSIRLVAYETDKEVVLQVKDTGIGIPENEQAKIFDRFYRVDKDRSKEKGGSGLGLSILKWIVEAHEGKITIESGKGEGTSVVIYLPKQ